MSWDWREDTVLQFEVRQEALFYWFIWQNGRELDYNLEDL